MRTLPTYRPPLWRIWRAVMLWWLRYRLEALRDEVAGYINTPYAGEQYLFNMAAQEWDLQRRINSLEFMQ